MAVADLSCAPALRRADRQARLVASERRADEADPRRITASAFYIEELRTNKSHKCLCCRDLLSIVTAVGAAGKHRGTGRHERGVGEYPALEPSGERITLARPAHAIDRAQALRQRQGPRCQPHLFNRPDPLPFSSRARLRRAAGVPAARPDRRRLSARSG